MKRPAFQFYPADWRKDAELQSCSIAARGLWVEAMCVAHECDPYGHLTVNGKPMTVAQLARLVGVPPKECDKLVDELLAVGVASKTESGAIFSRRMVRDEEKRAERAKIGKENGAKGAEFGQLGAEHGRKGGRPRQADIPGSEPGQKPPQNPRPSSSSSSSASARDQTPSVSSSARPTIPCPYAEIVKRYHEALPELPRVRIMDEDRQRLMRKFWSFALTSKKSDGTPRATDAATALQWSTEFFLRARENPWLMGTEGRGPGHENWRPDFDYLLSKKGMKQVIEKTRAA